MSPHDAGVHGAVLTDQEEKKTLQGAYRAVIGIADSVAASSPRALASECWTKFPCNIPGVLEQDGDAACRSVNSHTHTQHHTHPCITGTDIVGFPCVSGPADPRPNCCSHGNLLRFGLQGSRLNICYYNQDLHLSALHVGSHLTLRSCRPAPAYSSLVIGGVIQPHYTPQNGASAAIYIP